MQEVNPIPIVDLFAGPGGLGEGFSAAGRGRAFKILVSAEMDEHAHQTLRLRAFYRILKRRGASMTAPYYRFCNGISSVPWDASSEDAWHEAGLEARRITLGTPEGNRELESVIAAAGLGPQKPWVLIGGPPCQAYSLVGRSRNRGNSEYRPEDDPRHFLYKEYLRVIQRHKPAIFVMENVKGMLSARVGNQQIFHSILKDLSDPDRALGYSSTTGYRIYSLSTNVCYERSMEPGDVDAQDFVVRAEEYEIPQARHRVILLGVREDFDKRPSPLREGTAVSVREALRGLPKLRSRISRGEDGAQEWAELVKCHARELAKDARRKRDLAPLVTDLERILNRVSSRLNAGALRLPRDIHSSEGGTLGDWYRDGRLNVWLNHEARSHMSSDLRRYLYASSFARTFGRSPKGHKEFDLAGLGPAHKNWESGNFADRFRVQIASNAATTITSHISKDGHYFIHPDPAQCRSLTVREAARLQTFPDNYFFQGARTQQFHQVGNAVPPLLAFKIAKVVSRLCNGLVLGE